MQRALLAAWAAALVGARDAGLGAHRAVRGAKGKAKGWKVDGDGWNYNARGADWGGACSITNTQSPIDLSKAPQTVNSKVLFYRYPPLYEAVMSSLNSGMVLSANLLQSKGELAIGLSSNSYPLSLEKHYQLTHLEIHTPSEHTFGNATVPLEIQLHHRDYTNGDWAIAAIGFKAGPDTDDEVLKGLASGGLPDHEHEDVFGPGDGGTNIELGQLFKLPSVFLQYTGTTTSPPCTKSTTWFVRQDALQADDALLDKFRESVADGASVHAKEAGNSRRLQPVGDRKVSVFTAVNALNQEPASVVGLPAYLMTTTTVGVGAGVTAADQSTAAQLTTMEQKLSDATLQLTTANADLLKAQQDVAAAGAGATQIQANNVLAAAEVDQKDKQKLVDTLQQSVDKLKAQQTAETAVTPAPSS